MAAAAVLKNNVIVGSVNANKRHWYKANDRLARLDRNSLSRLMTRYEKPENCKQALEKKPDDIKVVIRFSENLTMASNFSKELPAKAKHA